MPRATDADVRALVEMRSEVSTTPFITSASVYAGQFLAGKGLSEELLTQLEIYIAAHFAVLAVERGGLLKDTMGESSSTYKQPSNRLKGFESTGFGQAAITMDPSGTLSQASLLDAQFQVISGAYANPNADSAEVR